MSLRVILFFVFFLFFLQFNAVAQDDRHIDYLLQPSSCALSAPPFNMIHDDDFLPAFKEAMQRHLIEINKIANQTSPPTFDNTIVAMEKSGQSLERVSHLFFALVQANTNKTLQQSQKIITPLLAKHADEISLNPKLFARIKTLYDQRTRLQLSPEGLRLLTIYYQEFVHDGATLSAKNKELLKKLNQQEATLETDFEQKLIAASNAAKLVINDKADLSGLSQNEIAAITQKHLAREEYIIPLQNTTQQPLLKALIDRDTRIALFNHSWTRTEKGDSNDTRNIVLDLARIRAQKAALFDAPNYAQYALYNQMAKTPQAVQQFLQQLIPAIHTNANKEAKVLQSLIDDNVKQVNHSKFALKPWDWDFYTEQLRKQKYALNESEIKPYFELNTVLNAGLFYTANKLFGIQFKERFDLPVYHPDVRVFTVYDKDGSTLGLLYLDYFKRDNKSGGAWEDSFVTPSTLLRLKPVVFNVANFTKPAAGQPALLSFDDVTTMFHEFGHALHGLFTQVTYPTLASGIARDFVEFPSQFYEHWATQPEVLSHYAIHYQTKQPMPQHLIDKIQQMITFNQGYEMGEKISAAELDMQWHQIGNNRHVTNVDVFEKQALENSHTNFNNVPPRYRSSYFLHIWANGYEAGYYSYLWSEMLDDDAFTWFKQHGGLTSANGQRYRDMILSKGRSSDYAAMFRAFYGKTPDIKPMLEYRGLST